MADGDVLAVVRSSDWRKLVAKYGPVSWLQLRLEEAAMGGQVAVDELVRSLLEES